MKIMGKLICFYLELSPNEQLHGENKLQEKNKLGISILISSYFHKENVIVKILETANTANPFFCRFISQNAQWLRLSQKFNQNFHVGGRNPVPTTISAAFQGLH